MWVTDMLPFILIGLIVLLFTVFVFMIAPAKRKHEDRKILKGLFIAHRGLHDASRQVPENSIAAFRAAAEKGYAIENDIHLTKDGRVVVFHDDDLYRMCSIKARPEDMTLEELKKLRLGGTDEAIPTLEECLEVIDGRVPLLIEFKCKSGSAAPICIAADAILRGYNGKYFVQSFYPPVLSWYKRNRKDVMRGQLSSAFKGDKLHMRMLGCLLFNFMSRPDFVSYDFKYAKEPSRLFCGLLGAFPVGWTFKDQKDIESCRKQFDAYIFEGFLPE
ncbi:MAG: glycerophosphodiester phosphodiesterase [Clostridia bacterium]|nr:glycerophosphodiester phosphodiesterase [Clostridia bacterium]